MTPSSKSSRATRDRLLDAAEQLFSEKGLSGASMRDITQAAGTNLAAVNYHFGSKRELLRAVLEHRLTPINERRLQELDALEADADRTPTLEDVLRAFIVPTLDPDLAPTSHFVQIMARLHSSSDPTAHTFLQEVVGPVATRFMAKLRELLPELSPEAVHLRMQFVIGALVHAPRHSTSSQENLPSADSSCGFSATFRFKTPIRSSAPQIIQDVVPQIWKCATDPTGCSWNMK